MEEAEHEEQYFCNQEEDADHEEYDFEDSSFADSEED